jgi:hypothetical protein
MQGRSLDTTLGVSWARVWSAMPLQMPVSLGEAGALRSRFTNVARRSSRADLFRSRATLFTSLPGPGAIFERGLEIPNMPLTLIAGSGHGDHAGSFSRCLPERFDRYLLAAFH